MLTVWKLILFVFYLFIFNIIFLKLTRSTFIFIDTICLFTFSIFKTLSFKYAEIIMHRKKSYYSYIITVFTHSVFLILFVVVCWILTFYHIQFEIKIQYSVQRYFKFSWDIILQMPPCDYNPRNFQCCT